jgi:hypothetical protein
MGIRVRVLVAVLVPLLVVAQATVMLLELAATWCWLVAVLVPLLVVAQATVMLLG